MVKLGKYDLIAKIATGGMAEIHLARSHAAVGVDKIVVVKKLLAEYEGRKDFIDMFLDEARVAASLNHPNVVQMHDFGEVSGSHFMAMEYLDGEDLRRIYKHYAVDKVMLPLRFALHVAAAACAGLHHAHDACGSDGQSLQIVHRDVSPHNIFVTIDGAVKIVDFGIAKAKNRASATKHGTLKGKAPYMAPEQVRNLELDRRCDVYALGVVLYELTTGKRPYILDEASEFALLTAIVKGQVRKPSEVIEDYPPELEEIVMRALALAPADRFQSALEMQSALEDYIVEKNLAVTPRGLSKLMIETFGERAKGRLAIEKLAAIEAARAVRVEEDEATLSIEVDVASATDPALRPAAEAEEPRRKRQATVRLDEILVGTLAPRLHAARTPPVMVQETRPMAPSSPNSLAPMQEITTSSTGTGLSGEMPSFRAASPNRMPIAFATLGLLMLLAAGAFWYGRTSAVGSGAVAAGHAPSVTAAVAPPPVVQAPPATTSAMATGAPATEPDAGTSSASANVRPPARPGPPWSGRPSAPVQAPPAVVPAAGAPKDIRFER